MKSLRKGIFFPTQHPDFIKLGFPGRERSQKKKMPNFIIYSFTTMQLIVTSPFQSN